jgi:hypothetical protein
MVDQRPTGNALREVLAEWRSLEHELSSMVASSIDRSRVQAEVVALRVAYGRLFSVIRGVSPDQARPDPH